jgi:hypothetical protein
MAPAVVPPTTPTAALPAVSAHGEALPVQTPLARPTSDGLAAAGLRAFELTPPDVVAGAATIGPTPTTLVAVSRRGAARHHGSSPAPAGSGGQPAPAAPSAPSPNAAGTGAGAASSGLTSGLWFDLFLVALAFLGLGPRRLRVRPVLAGPVGVVSLLQRPG